MFTNVHSAYQCACGDDERLIGVRHRPRLRISSMRDIRIDLKERLAAMEAERDATLAKARELDERIAALTKVLDTEDIFSQPKNEKEKPRPEKSIADFVYEQLAL